MGLYNELTWLNLFNLTNLVKIGPYQILFFFLKKEKNKLFRV
jgi:hypothetical protein